MDEENEVPVGVALMMQPLQLEAVGSVGKADKLVATRRRYPEVAPETEDHEKVTGRFTPVALLLGLVSVGAGRLPNTVTRIGADSFRTFPALSIACKPYQ